jgi:hypothetical protein
MSAIKRLSVREFVSEGYLQEVNRQFLHPHGLALEVTVNERTGDGYISGIWDYRHDPEGIVYADGEIDQAKARKVDLMAEQRAPARRRLLGFIVQPVSPPSQRPSASSTTRRGS